MVVNDTNELYAATMETNQLLRAILEKDADVYLNKRSVGSILASDVTTAQKARTRMEKMIKGIKG